MNLPINISGRCEFMVINQEMDEVKIDATSYKREINNIDFYCGEELICSFSNYRQVIKLINEAK